MLILFLLLFLHCPSLGLSHVADYEQQCETRGTMRVKRSKSSQKRHEGGYERRMRKEEKRRHKVTIFWIVTCC